MKIQELHIDAYGCKEDLNNPKLLLPVFINAAESVKAKVVKKIIYQYKPYGITLILLLAESHISLFTWPEFGYAAVEIFLCNENMDPSKVWNVIEKTLMPKKVRIIKVVRKIS
jgi:S-adenosylmethionine decarboxylase